MNRALWIKTLREGRWLLVGCGLLLFVFHWIRVWITSQFDMKDISKLLQFAPEFIKKFFVVPIEVIADPAGRIAVAYDDPLVLVVVSLWAITRGSDVVSGEVSRGTMEMLLSQPVRRGQVLLSHGVVTVAGCAVLAMMCWLGTWVGLMVITLESDVASRIFLAPASNVFALGMFIAGASTMVSACDRYRWRTIAIVVGFCVVQLLLKVVSIAVPSFAWLRWTTFLTAFEPQKIAHAFWPRTLAVSADQSWQLLIDCNALLILFGLIGYGLAALVFSHRDLPAPL